MKSERIERSDQLKNYEENTKGLEELKQKHERRISFWTLVDMAEKNDAFDTTRYDKDLRKQLLFAYIYVFHRDIGDLITELEKGNNISANIKAVKNSTFNYYEKLVGFAYDYFMQQNVTDSEIEFIEENKLNFAKTLNEAVLEIAKLNKLLEEKKKESNQLIILEKELFNAAVEFNLVAISNEKNREVLRETFIKEFNSGNEFNPETIFDKLISKISQKILKCPRGLKKYYKVQLKKDLINFFINSIENSEKRNYMTVENLLKEDIQFIEHLKKFLDRQENLGGTDREKIFELTRKYYNFMKKNTYSEYKKEGDSLIKKICCKRSSKEVKKHCAEKLESYYRKKLEKVQEKAKKHKKKDNGKFSVLKKIFSCFSFKKQPQIQAPLPQAQNSSLNNDRVSPVRIFLPESKSASPAISIRRVSPSESKSASPAVSTRGVSPSVSISTLSTPTITVVSASTSALTSPETSLRRLSTASDASQETKSNHGRCDKGILLTFPNTPGASVIYRGFRNSINITTTMRSGGNLKSQR